MRSQPDALARDTPHPQPLSPKRGEGSGKLEQLRGLAIGVVMLLGLLLTFNSPTVFSESALASESTLASQSTPASQLAPPTNSSLMDHDLLVDRLQERVVKLFGAGGARGLESYQSGILVGNEGLIVTSWTTVLDVARVRVVAFDGRRLDATVVGTDPANEIALLKVENLGLVGFDLETKQTPSVGQRVFAISNLFGIATGNEYCSVQRGVVMATAPLTQRRGRTKSLYQGKVYILDVMTNNPGASGGALVDLQGNLLGLLGKEIRDEQAGIWVNYALPMDVVRASIKRIQEGTAGLVDTDMVKAVDRPHRLNDLGITMIPDVLPKTPAFVDQVREGSIAAQMGIQSNDLILLVNDQRIDSRRTLERILSTINRADSFELLLQRGQELIRVQVRP